MMKEWPQIELNELSTKITKGTTPTTLGLEFTQEGINFIKAESITREGRINESTFAKISLKTHEALRRSQIIKDDVLITIAGIYLGKIGLIRESQTPANTNQAIAIVRPNQDRISPTYLKNFLFLPSTTTYLNILCPQSAQPNLNLTQLRRLKVPTPPLSVQRRIAAILSAYDDLIENNNGRIAILEKMAEELYREWFVRLRFPGHEKAKIVKGVPEGWAVKYLPDTALITYGFPFDGSRFNQDGLGKPIIRIRNIPDGSTTDFTDEGAQEKYVVRKGDLLVGMDGEFHINHWYGDEALLVQRVCRIKARQERLGGYLAKAVYAPVKFYESILQGATVGHLGAKHLNSIIILVPGEDVNLEIFNELLDKKIQISSSTNILKKARDRLLTRLMSGKIDVEDLDIQFPPSMMETDQEKQIAVN